MDGDGLDANGRIVGVAPGLVEVGKATVEGATGVKTGVAGPQPGERLRDVKDDITNCVSADLLATFGDGTSAVSEGKDLEDGDFVAEVREVGVKPERSAERQPDVVPGAGRGRDATGGHAVEGRLRSKAEVRAEKVDGASG